MYGYIKIPEINYDLNEEYDHAPDVRYALLNISEMYDCSVDKVISIYNDYRNHNYSEEVAVKNTESYLRFKQSYKN